ncbi:putative isopentenyltransferase [Heterostelium album PN500]|uniref:Putative isopentenyltransferase n=1 Tax=Heterostelium pallidum (strain ATCC 26659 / Pp 5 / PN500) TaxID=670386 RepID=D3B614_HETP5|nr:putative isopentenyltransferase [Heterostelium album PN500]EFA83312.1 putative isopentenyltransferase [Heterostelium album PN500]|eukprot:XP_020435429.1 putative isopentenyltransferase [Heterostelium album PN500]
MDDNLVIFILGTTGVGKSKLSIELAKKYNGEIISSDSMQLYKGADVITNKVTTDEMEGIPHHMMSLLELNQLSYNVGNFISTVIPIVCKIPIIVGGTHYYTTSILWSNTLISYDEQDTANNNNNNNNNNSNITSNTDSTTTTTTISNNNNDDNNSVENNERVYSYEKLKEVDELMAKKLHSNDFRKIKRSLDIYYDTGRKHSDMVLEQKNSRVQRYRSCLIWLDCSNQVLEQRLNERVDQMIDRGMVKECFDIFGCEDLINAESTENFTKGLTQAIGVKELYPYYLLKVKRKKKEKEEGVNEGNITSTADSSDSLGEGTTGTVCPTDKVENETVFFEAKEMGEETLTGQVGHTQAGYERSDALANGENGNEDDNGVASAKNSNNKRSSNSSLDQWEKHYCQVCDNREINGIVQWRNHLKSKQHTRNQQRQQRQLKQQQQQQQQQETTKVEEETKEEQETKVEQQEQQSEVTVTE